MSSKFLWCLSTPLLLGSTSVENFEQHIKQSLEVADFCGFHPVNLAPRVDLMKLEKILKY